MADTEQVRDAGRRLASDLRDLREARKIKTEEIVNATRLSEDVLESFDESALVDHPAYNRVYLRSVMLSYARVLEIKEGHILKAMEEALAGTYTDGLRRIYIHGAQDDEWSDDDAQYLETDESGPDEKQDEAQLGIFAAEHEQSSDPYTPVPPSKPETETDEDGPDISRYIMIVAALMIAVLAIFWLMRRESSLDEATAPSGDEEIVPSVPEPEWIVLGDSMRFDIVATTEPLDPIRVKVDTDLRRPFWIEHLDTLTFYAFDTIIFERELDVADIFLDGYLLSDSLIDPSDRLVLDRDRAQDWLDAVAVERASLN